MEVQASRRRGGGDQERSDHVPCGGGGGELDEVDLVEGKRPVFSDPSVDEGRVGEEGAGGGQGDTGVPEARQRWTLSHVGAPGHDGSGLIVHNAERGVRSLTPGRRGDVKSP
eukprot:765576-Hanusia_phi.AAC.4